jgi:hypothetical protein
MSSVYHVTYLAGRTWGTKQKKIAGSAWPRGQKRGGPPPCRHDD